MLNSWGCKQTRFSEWTTTYRSNRQFWGSFSGTMKGLGHTYICIDSPPNCPPIQVLQVNGRTNWESSMNVYTVPCVKYILVGSCCIAEGSQLTALWWHACQVTSMRLDSLWPHGQQPNRLLCPWNFLGKNTGVSCHFLLQGIFPTQWLKLRLLCLLHWPGVLYH